VVQSVRGSAIKRQRAFASIARFNRSRQMAAAGPCDPFAKPSANCAYETAGVDVKRSSPIGLRPFKRASSTATGAASSGCAHSSGSPALIRASRNLGSVSTQAELCARKNAKESLGFKFIASAIAAFASGILSAAA
jgi:hypothetical protein